MPVRLLHRHRAFHIAALALLTALAVPALRSHAEPEPADAQRVGDAKGRFTVALPAGWTVESRAEGGDAKTPAFVLRAPSDGPDDKVTERLSVVVKPIPEEPSRRALLSFCARAELDAILNEGPKTIERGGIRDREIGGEPALWVDVYRDDEHLRIRQTVVVKGDDLFVIRWTGSQSYRFEREKVETALYASWQFANGK